MEISEIPASKIKTNDPKPENKTTPYENSVILRCALQNLLDATQKYLAKPDPAVCPIGELWRHEQAVSGLISNMDKSRALLAALDRQ